MASISRKQSPSLPPLHDSGIDANSPDKWFKFRPWEKSHGRSVYDEYPIEDEPGKPPGHVPDIAPGNVMSPRLQAQGVSVATSVPFASIDPAIER